MIKSMTGFAVAEKSAGEITVAADIRSFNSRHLDVVLRLPASCMTWEDRVKGLIAERIVRGRVEVKVQVKDESEQAAAFEDTRDRLGQPLLGRALLVAGENAGEEPIGAEEGHARYFFQKSGVRITMRV